MKTESEVSWLFSLQRQLPLSVSLHHNFFTWYISLQLNWKSYLSLTVPYIAALHIVGVQEELTTWKGKVSPIHTWKKDSNFTLKVQPSQKPNKTINLLLSVIKCFKVLEWNQHIHFQSFVIINYSPPSCEMWTWISSKHLSNKPAAPNQSPQSSGGARIPETKYYLST